ncbi:MAG TPA: response regulator transcription factor [Polyangiaceae bacterium LLY-WYZ-15_(1-7)]|nr:response regulator transcription factor [Polyangiaceae bacterium LLY-WYZ-15_(1-7)]HJL03537.1 response regulator transcription factor [Polyangiaceae bacterium LLY-WYZ-15_(1-7)]HJL09421.1 response regulator transcription factor [Polyangiaceae bacterium LLY-WYZ-15_(1-7)]HJL21350.1 response regulator transcription factor [Polyangiaceae bacterium LLY-WYZ-15_(1-7)]HJL29945.1 response regulator transcription factor [Polyangiaceae bacterium LLY-WYZ-15_(1-7)]
MDVDTILIVEDDPALGMGLQGLLEFEGFEVLHAKTGEAAIELAEAEAPACIILDLMLPDVNGYQVCERIRRSDAHVPILMLTARSQETDKIRGLDAGADDYVTKPFSNGELVARIRALLRRASRSAAPVEQPFELAGCTIDPAKQILVREGGEEEQLSFYEVELLKLLFARQGQPVSRDDILDQVWGLEATPSNRTVDNFIVKLRKKLEPVPEKPRHILTVYGVGYKLVP